MKTLLTEAMKTVDYHWDNPALAKYKKQIRKGDCLFKQGESGKSMIIIIKGVVQLTGEREGRELAVGFVGAGEFLGEKAILRPEIHHRVFGAYAVTDLSYLELSLGDVEAIEKNNPALLKDILKQMFLLAARRLDQSNYLVRVLRSSNNVLRLVQLIVYLAKCTGVNSKQGIELILTVDQIRYYIDMNEFEIEECIRELVSRGILVRAQDNHYFIASIEMVLNAVDVLRESLPSIQAID